MKAYDSQASQNFPESATINVDAMIMKLQSVNSNICCNKIKLKNDFLKF